MIGKILIVIEVVRAARALIKDTQSDLKEIKKASKDNNVTKIFSIVGKEMQGSPSKIKCRRALVRKKMKEYQGE